MKIFINWRNVNTNKIIQINIFIIQNRNHQKQKNTNI